MSNRHAHINTHSVDCDGPRSSHYVETMIDSEIAESGQVYNDFSEIHFRERVLGNIVDTTTYRDGQTGRAEFTEHGFSFWRDTDEGGNRAEVIWCEDDCDLGMRGQRDYFAEAMGY